MIEVHKSDLHLLPAMEIDENPTTGNIRIVEEINARLNYIQTRLCIKNISRGSRLITELLGLEVITKHLDISLGRWAGREVVEGCTKFFVRLADYVS